MQKNYVVVSPVRNEEEYIEKTIKAVIEQTILPLEWVLVNDGSTDHTAEIIESYQKKYPWITRVDLSDRGYYLPGEGIINAFYAGFDKLKEKNWSFVVKLDCDLSFQNDYFEILINKFEHNPKLGIASGCIYNVIHDKLIKEKSQEDHPFGASKIYRKECFESIGGIKRIPGWDLADLLSAQMNNWETRCYFDLVVEHYKIGGSRRSGFTKGKFLQGRFQYRFGYTFFYTLLKSIYHLTSRPFIISGVGLISGYIYAALRKEKRYYDPDMIVFLRKRQKKFLMQKFKKTA